MVMGIYLFINVWLQCVPEKCHAHKQTFFLGRLVWIRLCLQFGEGIQFIFESCFWNWKLTLSLINVGCFTELAMGFFGMSERLTNLLMFNESVRVIFWLLLQFFNWFIGTGNSIVDNWYLFPSLFGLFRKIPWPTLPLKTLESFQIVFVTAEGMRKILSQ